MIKKLETIETIEACTKETPKLTRLRPTHLIGVSGVIESYPETMDKLYDYIQNNFIKDTRY